MSATSGPMVSGEGRHDLAGRYLQLAVDVVTLVGKLPPTTVGRHLGGQLLRAGTSPGANYEEACGAESRADFIHKMSIVLKELKESRYWLRVSLQAHLLPEAQLAPVLSECEELCAITAKSIFTAKQRGLAGRK